MENGKRFFKGKLPSRRICSRLRRASLRQRHVKTAAHILLLCILCNLTLFTFSHRFVNAATTAKWLGMELWVGVAGLILCALCRKLYLPAKAILLLMLTSCLAVFFRDLFASGFSGYLLVYAVCIALLFLVLQQIAEALAAEYLFGSVAISAAVVAVHGLLQYAGVALAANSFRVTGTFDNPAGFAAALAASLPYVFLFFRNPRRVVVYISVAIAFVILLAAVLSGSRAAMLAGLVAVSDYAGSRYSGIKWKKWLKISLICMAVAGVTALYFLKKDSADGRLLIWQNTWSMVLDRPIAGHGYGAFNAQYMLYQAEYFAEHPHSRYAMLADNVQHPFNEYLLLLSEHGVAGLGILLLLLLPVARSYLRNPGKAKLIALLSLLSLAVFSCFSYPFKYPFTWIIVFLNIATVCPAAKISSGNANKVVRAGTALAATVLLFTGIALMKAEMRWNAAARQSLAGKTVEMLPEYDKLYKYLGKNGLFLYNHAAELHEVKEYEKSLSVFDLCTEHYNDMDVQMLLADSYKELKRAEEAERHFLLASAMCPNRFMPLYQLVELYNATGRRSDAIALAQKIAAKKVKIPSPTVNAIKNKMKQLVSEQEKTAGDSENDSKINGVETKQ